MPFPHRIRSFITELNRDYPNFDTKLNIFFDNIGFTKDFPKTAPKGPLLRSHAVKDNVWGMIEFNEPIRRLIDSPLVQRLRGIHQNGLSHLTYPTATHTRFAHTLGVYHCVVRLLDESQRTFDLNKDRSDVASLQAANPSASIVELLKRAAILHDIGHGPYSHVSEGLFSPDRENLLLGGIPLNDLLRRFRLEYFDVRNPKSPRPSGGKPLSEIISCLFICSSRFKEFYDASVTPLNLNGEHDVYNFAALILGDRISEDDLATPAILSSAIDADKIDYMLRDAQACGISLSIDPSRTFQGAGIYSLPVRDDPYFGEKDLTNTNNVKVFVIDKSGSDTYFQVGVSRLSLYSRIYHHPLTRNAEFQFRNLLRQMQDGDPDLKDVLAIWPMSEGEIFHAARISSQEEIRNAAHSFAWRQFPKRAANLELSAMTFCFLSPHTEKFENSFAKLVTESLYPAFEDSTFRDRISERISNITNTLGIQPTGSLDLGYIPPPNSEDAIIGHTRLIDRASQRLVKCEFHVPSYLQAGALSERRSYIVVREEMREIAAVATAVEMFDFGLNKITTQNLKQDLVDANEFAPRQIAFLPMLDMAKVSNTCKISHQKIAETLGLLESKLPFEPALRLLNRPLPSTRSLGVADKFASFHGAKGWRVTQAHLQNFIAQFPTRLRADLLTLLDRFHVFDRSKICADIQRAINKVAKEKKQGKAYIVPFTMNSGHLTLSFMRDSVSFPDETWILKDSLRAALAELQPNDWVVFVDDHAASGTQVRRRLSNWVKGGSYAGGDSQLETNYLATFKSANVSFAFASMADQGNEVIRELQKELELTIPIIAYGVPFEDYSLKPVLTELAELRDFLQTVGTGLMLPRFQHQPFSERVVEAAKFSLGYQNAEGGLITELNVPTSTCTAFWRPGSFDPAGNYASPEDSRFPWMPLFIRSSHIDQVQLF